MNIVNIVFGVGFFIIISTCVLNNQIPISVGLFANVIIGFIVGINIAEGVLK